jgi:hypothetical protein
VVDFYHNEHPDSWKGGIFAGTNPHWPDSLVWSHTLPLDVAVPPGMVIRAKLWIDAHAVNTDGNTVEIQGVSAWDPLNHRVHDNTAYDLSGADPDLFWNQASISVLVRAVESLIRIDEAMLLIDYESSHTGVTEEFSTRPIDFRLVQNYPNPFNPETQISFSLPERTTVLLAVYNIRGRKVRQLIEGTLPGGSYKIAWDGTDDQGNRLASGIYFCRLSSGPRVSTSKMILMK